MRRAVLATWFLVGCSFTPGAAPATADGPAATGDGGAALAPCHDAAGDPTLRLCLDFEDAPVLTVAHDLSPDHDDASVALVQSIMRHGEHAVQLAPGSSIATVPSAALSLTTAFSIEMWVDTTSQAPGGGFVFPLAVPGDYALSIDHDGNLGCFVGNVAAGTGMPVNYGDWVHIACTFDGQKIRIYQNGTSLACVHAQPPAPFGVVPAQVGAAYTGDLDDVHVYARTLSDQDICQHATGNSDCGGGCD